MTNLITPDVLRTAAENITAADAVTDYAAALYTEKAWPGVFGGTTDRPAIFMSYSDDHEEVARGGPFQESFHASLVARVVAEVARTVVTNATGNSKFVAEDVLESLYDEITHVRTDGYWRGVFVVFTATEVD